MMDARHAIPSPSASQAAMSESNRSHILDHLFRHGVSSRAEIAQALALTPAAITKITARLIDAGIIRETGDIEGRKKRRSIGLSLANDTIHVIGVKFARSIVQIGVFDLAGAQLSLQTLPPVTERTIRTTLNQIRTGIQNLLDEDRHIIAVGMAVPGPYLRDVGRTAVVSSMEGWRKVNFLHEFSQRFRVPVFVEQDARAGALAHYLFDRANTCEYLAYYLIGEGLGLGVIEHGRLIDGALGAATEIGHVSIDVHGRPCECGNVGCLERYCSAVAIHQEILTRGLVAGADTMNHEEACLALFAAADDGDRKAQELVQEVGRYVGYGCVTIFNMFNPRRIVIGDIVSQAGPLLLRAVRDVVNERAIPELNDTTAISLSELSTDSAVSGGAAIAITHFLEHPSTFFDVPS